ncbi:MAG: hypothetical protein SVV03_03675 [Candidatus Nanohaloarchaea archaeon]|nr:hypothetical protein [Candidatus Nanohaloarchaea archaeon]
MAENIPVSVEDDQGGEAEDESVLDQLLAGEKDREVNIYPFIDRLEEQYDKEFTDKVEENYAEQLEGLFRKSKDVVGLAKNLLKEYQLEEFREAVMEVRKEYQKHCKEWLEVVDRHRENQGEVVRTTDLIDLEDERIMKGTEENPGVEEYVDDMYIQPLETEEDREIFRREINGDYTALENEDYMTLEDAIKEDSLLAFYRASELYVVDGMEDSEKLRKQIDVKHKILNYLREEHSDKFKKGTQRMKGDPRPTHTRHRRRG